MKVLAIDFVRQVIEQTLYEEHLKNPQFFGGGNQVKLFSFYEQLEEGYEVDRYKEIYDDLVKEQNRTGLIMNGTIVAPENPQIMNINSATIIPLSFTCSFRVTLANRDQTIETIDNLMQQLKGRKRDVACLSSGKLLVVGTIANNVLGVPVVKSNDFIGNINTENPATTEIESLLSTITSVFSAKGITPSIEKVNGTQYYVKDQANQLRVATYTLESTTWDLTENLKEFTKFKVSISFDTIRIDEPKTLDAQEYCTISFGGSATVCGANVELGNDLTKVGIAKSKVKADITMNCDGVIHYLEPLEMPNSLGISGEISQLVSNNFIQNKHNDGINPTFDYSFVLDRSESLINEWFKYSRYGIQGTPASTGTTHYLNGVSPNMIYKIYEIWSSWGNVEIFDFYAKATENVDIENTESDALTIKLTFELQKE